MDRSLINMARQSRLGEFQDITQTIFQLNLEDKTHFCTKQVDRMRFRVKEDESIYLKPSNIISMLEEFALAELGNSDSKLIEFLRLMYSGFKESDYRDSKNPWYFENFRYNKNKIGLVK